jgi:hypothetical protein
MCFGLFFKHILNTSVLTLTRQNMHIIHVKHSFEVLVTFHVKALLLKIHCCIWWNLIRILLSLIPSDESWRNTLLNHGHVISVSIQRSKSFHPSICLFTCSLFNGAVCNSDYISFNDWFTVNNALERWVKKWPNLRSYPGFVWEEHHEKSQPRYSVIGLGLEPVTSRIQVRSVYRSILPINLEETLQTRKLKKLSK